jgi:hypothetical protein
MMRIGYLAAAAAVLLAVPAEAADAKVTDAIATFKAVGADKAKLDTFCAMGKDMAASGEKGNAASDAKIDGYMKTLGKDFETAWNVGEGLDEKSDDAKALGDALDELEGKCPQ